MQFAEDLLFRTSKKSIGLLLILSLFPFVYGIIPGWKKMQSDFPNYYVSANLIANGKAVDSLYRADWFQNQIYSHGISEQGKFSPFPPPTALILTPIAGFDALSAKRIWLVFNILLLLPIVLLLHRISGLSISGSLILLLSCGVGLVNNFMLGQMYLLLLFILLSAYFFLLRGNAGSTGLLLGGGIAVKYFPLVFVPTLIAEKRWKSLASTAVMIALIHSVCMGIMGLQVYKEYILDVLFQHLNGNLSGQSSWSASFQSWNSLGHQLFLSHDVFNPKPLMNSLVCFYFVKYGIPLLVGIFTARLFFLYKKQVDFIEASLAMVSVAVLLCSPAGATYHGILLLFPLGLQCRILIDRKMTNGILLVLFNLLLIGYLPPLLEKLTVAQYNLFFTYTRLWLYMSLYILMHWQLYKISRMSEVKNESFVSPA